MKTITVVIDEQGDASVDLAGFNGRGCDKVLADFADGKAKVEKQKREYHQQAAPQAVRQGG